MSTRINRIAEIAEPGHPFPLDERAALNAPEQHELTQNVDENLLLPPLSGRTSKLGAGLASLLLGSTLGVYPTGLDTQNLEAARAEIAAQRAEPAELVLSKPHGQTAELERLLLKSPDYPIPKAVAEKLQDKNSDPKFRAASVVLFTRQPDDGRIRYGTAALNEQGDQLFLTTIEHVARQLEESSGGRAPTLGYFPGIGIMQLDIGPTKPIDRNSPESSDSVVAVRLSAEQQELLKAKRDVIKPLKHASVPFKLGDTYLIANPATGQFIEVVYTGGARLNIPEEGVDDEQESFLVSAASDEAVFQDGRVTDGEILNLRNRFKATMSPEDEAQIICSGFSGSPILRPQNHGVVAILSVADVNLRAGDGQRCGVYIFAQKLAPKG